MKNNISTIWLGEISYEAARLFIRESLHPLCRENKSFLVFCSHPATLTFGKNMSVKEKRAIRSSFDLVDTKIDLIDSDRGGKGTFHDPNQLMIYPVFNLGQLKIGIKAFIKKILSGLVSGLAEVGIDAFVDENLVGIWVDENDPRKIASVGFRLLNRCTDHGVALYVGDVSGEFSRFSPCGIENLKIVSISEIINRKIKLEELVPIMRERIVAVFC